MSANAIEQYLLGILEEIKLKAADERLSAAIAVWAVRALAQQALVRASKMIELRDENIDQGNNDE